jgi:hypothetical protein
MRQDLIRRLERLESQFEHVIDRVVLVWPMHRIDKGRRQALAYNERIVRDVYREIGDLGYSRERITTDRLDEGRRCPPRGYLEDVIREFHENCEKRKSAGCRDCDGLEYLFSPAGSENFPSGVLTRTTNTPSQQS